MVVMYDAEQTIENMFSALQFDRKCHSISMLYSAFHKKRLFLLRLIENQVLKEFGQLFYKLTVAAVTSSLAPPVVQHKKKHTMDKMDVNG